MPRTTRADHEAAFVMAWTRFHRLALRRHLWPCERERGRWVLRRAGEKRGVVRGDDPMIGR